MSRNTSLWWCGYDQRIQFASYYDSINSPTYTHNIRVVIPLMIVCDQFAWWLWLCNDSLCHVYTMMMIHMGRLHHHINHHLWFIRLNSCARAHQPRVRFAQIGPSPHQHQKSVYFYTKFCGKINNKPNGLPQCFTQFKPSGNKTFCSRYFNII